MLDGVRECVGLARCELPAEAPTRRETKFSFFGGGASPTAADATAAAAALGAVKGPELLPNAGASPHWSPCEVGNAGGASGKEGSKGSKFVLLRVLRWWALD